ncbi:MAG: MBOAT family O-acyltransferase [Leptospira sp.]|nr:MBOAT family O-acyltransferase [Leptospira sp.]
MKFTSLSFLLFFLIVYVLNWVLKGKARHLFLFVVSVLFYAAWSIPFAFHFLAIVIINHFANIQIQKNQKSKWFYSILILNFGNLFLFKYFYFVWDSLLYITASPLYSPEHIRSFLESQFGFESITLPLAISFYSFQMIAYTIDVKRGEAKENPNFLQFALFIFFFPQLVAGPIVRHGEFFHQLQNWEVKKHQLFEGLYLVFLGLIKKVVVADNLAQVTDPIFFNPNSFDGVSNGMALVGFACRAYCDFSGYTDLARGLGKLLGIDLPENFKAPFLASSISEVWTRWHMTLASWIRDYIYIPLGGSRVNEIRSYFNLLLTFSLTGLWHGANITFFLWGFSHGTLLCLERKWNLFRKAKGGDINLPLPMYRKILGIIYAFGFFSLTTAFFNASNVSISKFLLKNTFLGNVGLRTPKLELLFYSLILTYLFNYLQLKESFPRKEWSTLKSISFLFVFGFVSLILLGYLAPGGTEFIYFQF